MSKIATTTGRKRKLALLLPAHNEELIIQATITSAVAAGQKLEDIFVVDDNSADETRKKALELLPKANVLTVPRSGKALAVNRAIKHFKIEARFTWVHIADADSIFGPDYFRLYRAKLDAKKYVVAVGFVQSLRGNWISKYRAFTYTFSQHILRRFQSWLGMITVFPGPITCFRTDIIKDLEFDGTSLTEDFDVTLQVHRKKLGKIRFIPEAVSFTQDPQTLTDFYKQNLRWQRGFFQGVLRHKIGLKAQAIDLSIGYQLFEITFYLVQLFIVIPVLVISTGKWHILPMMFLADYLVVVALGVFSAIAAKRLSILFSLPYFYFLRTLELIIFMQAFVEVVILRKFRAKITGWETAGRRYQVDANALKDTAQ
jgi:biofilm PGA synthesis N-glycosyltransferase PgaC